MRYSRRIPALVSLLVLGCVDGGGPTVVVPPAPTSGFAALAVGIHHGCGIVADEGTYCWGLNVAGELGDGTVMTSLLPCQRALRSSFARSPIPS